MAQNLLKPQQVPKSIAKQIHKAIQNVFRMTDRKALGKKARKWVIDNFSTESVGKFFDGKRIR